MYQICSLKDGNFLFLALLRAIYVMIHHFRSSKLLLFIVTHSNASMSQELLWIITTWSSQIRTSHATNIIWRSVPTSADVRVGINWYLICVYILNSKCIKVYRVPSQPVRSQDIIDHCVSDGNRKATAIYHRPIVFQHLIVSMFNKTNIAWAWNFNAIDLKNKTARTISRPHWRSKYPFLQSVTY